MIPESALLAGTIRTVSASTRERVIELVEQVAAGIATAHGALAEVDVMPGYPVTVNSEAAADFALTTAGRLLGADRTVPMPSPAMGAEDWSYVLERVNGAMAFLGTRPPGVPPQAVAPNHSNRMVIDESAMAPGIAAYAGVALRWMAEAPAV